MCCSGLSLATACGVSMAMKLRRIGTTRSLYHFSRSIEPKTTGYNDNHPDTGGALVGLDQRVDEKGLSELVNRLSVLFRLVRRPREQTIRGLWAELFVILTGSDPGMML